MAYIGRQPTIGNYVKCSALVADGSTTTFTLTNSTNGESVVPGSENNMLVSVSGVIQNPGTAFTVSDNQITFTVAPGASDTIDFIVILGDALAIGEPSDNTVTNAKLVDGTISNAKLANNSITINGTSINLGASGDIVAGTDWQPVITADGSTTTTTVAGEGYFIDTTSNSHTIILPSSPTQGDTIAIADYAGTFATNNVTINRNGNNIQGAAGNGTIETNNQNVRFTYVDATKGWIPTIDATAGNYGALYVAATGGTVTTSGDYKIHTFTGAGCFVVSCAGNNAGSNKVSYMVVAGGAGSGAGASGSNWAGGGGAGGGFREGKCTSDPYSASPIVAPDGLSVSASTYPITVGGGGTGISACGPGQGGDGSNSVFSTITSAGGGGGGNRGDPSTVPTHYGRNGGSGGGAAGYNLNSVPGGMNKGSGNTPPVSPPQGKDGGQGGWSGGGGGGAAAVGSDADSNIPTSPSTLKGGNGGAGAITSINATPTQFAGGGGGGGAAQTGCTPGPIPSATGGTATGGGGAGGNGHNLSNNNGNAGTTNTGGGAGGAGGGGIVRCAGASGANGGSGIVVIRYKYQ